MCNPKEALKDESATEPELGSAYECRILGRENFDTAVDRLIEKGFAQKVSGVELFEVPEVTHGNIMSLVETFASDIEIGVIRRGLLHYVFRGFASSGFTSTGRDIPARFFNEARAGDFVIHAHPCHPHDFTLPSMLDVAYARQPNTTYAVLGGRGITEFTGVKTLLPYSGANPREEAYYLTAVFQDLFPAAREIEEQQRIMTELGMELNKIPWGQETEDFVKKALKL